MSMRIANIKTNNYSIEYGWIIVKHVEYLGDERLRHKVVYKEGQYSDCIYCGKQAKTREHIPSKVFLEKPFPDNLGIVPACVECNKSFSKDELFLSLLIEILKSKHYGHSYVFTEDTAGRMVYNKTLVKEIETTIEKNRLTQFEDRISKIIFKLAIGHSVFELSEGYCLNNGSLRYSFANMMSHEEIEEFKLPFNIGDSLLPEIGSRVYDRIMVIELDLAAVHSSEQKLKTQLVLLDWIDVQDNKYIYTCYRFGEEIVVKLIISDFLYAEVIINTEEY